MGARSRSGKARIQSADDAARRTRGDYGRQLVISASTDDEPLLRETADNVRRTWNELRPVVESHGGIGEARRFNDLVRDLEHSGPSEGTGGRLRDRIYEIEQVLQQRPV